MRINEEKLKGIIEELTLDKEQLNEIASALRFDMELALRGEEASMPMLCSYIGMPNGQEKGEFLALDFGGTNLRAELVSLKGDCQYEIVKMVAKPLVTEEYNLINGSASAEQVFDFIADMFAELLAGAEKKTYYLGHTFSFPSKQTDIYNARLIVWTKEFAIPGVEGEIVNDLLQAALNRKGLENVKVVAVINDTVAELLTAGYQYPDTQIGCIYATGSNNCYMERTSAADRPAAIINMESGSFNKLVPSQWDNQLDAESERPGNQRLEKMVSGRYMGELLSLTVQAVMDLPERPDFNAIDMSGIMSDTSATAADAAKVISAKIGELQPGEAAYIRDLTETIAIRSARIVAACFAGILWHLSGSGKIAEQHIAIDGSVYEHMPHIKESLNKGLSELLGEEAAAVTPMLLKDGSGLGAAIAAAVASKDL
ncbi:hexokinase family protein [Anaerovibrio slackiae]|uniref:hexokinase n=2 Tax=Anaerovibrio TaxID=82373 RepID=UPI0012B341CC|nr:hexokinase [Anaerovibrio slackiae]